MQNKRPVHDPLFRAVKIICKRCNKRERIIRSLYTKIERFKAVLADFQSMGECYCLDVKNLEMCRFCRTQELLNEKTK